MYFLQLIGILCFTFCFCSYEALKIVIRDRINFELVALDTFL